MNRFPLAAAALSALLAAAASIPYSGPAHAAGTAINHCRGADGVDIYTDANCAVLGAERLPMRGDLLARIARTQALEADADDAVLPMRTRVAVARRSPSAGCARSATQLAMDLEGAFALGDVNRIAESYHWVGLSSHQARPIMQRLDELAGRPLVQADYFDAYIGGGLLADASGGAGGPGGIMQLTFEQGDGGYTVVDADVLRYHGCYFVRF